MRETLQTTDGRSVLRLERTFGHPPDKVWEALTQPEHLTHWFPSDVELEPKVGGSVRFVFREGEAPPNEGVVTEFDPPRVLAYTWFDDLLRYELHARDGGCLLVFTHAFDDHAGAASFASGWELCFAGLGQVLDGQVVAVEPDDGALHESYVRRLGLDRGTSDDTDEGWVVCFERQLTRPAEEVWARLGAAGTDTPVVGGRVPHGFRVAQVEAGAITQVAEPELLEYDWLADGAPAGRVRWQLGPGTGHGARLVMTQTGGHDRAAVRATALDAWRDHIADVAGRLLTPPQPPAGSHGTLSARDDGRWMLRFERTFDQPREVVWQALTERAHLRRWFPAEADLDAPAGSAVRFASPSGRAVGGTGTIVHAAAPELLEYTWDDDVLRWELRATGDGGCALVFTHVFAERAGAADVGSGWHAGLEALAAQVAGRDLDWSVWERQRELQPEYVERFDATVPS